MHVKAFSCSPMVWMFLFMKKLKETDAYNVAMDAVVTDCQSNNVSRIIHDDSIKTMMLVDEYCETPGLARYIFRLREEYLISYFHLYHQCINNVRGVKYVKVYLNRDQFTEFCGMSRVALIEDYLINIHCQYTGMPFSRVIVDIYFETPFNLLDVRLYTLANKPHIRKHTLMYRGCFEMFHEDPEPLDWESCHTDCFKKGFIFAGIKDNSYCGCKNNVNLFEELPIEECDLLCEDGEGPCGAEDAFSVYVVNVPLPHYKGCYHIGDNIPYREFSRGYMTPRKCLYVCEDYNFAVVQHGNHCFCHNFDENDYSGEQPVYTDDCNTICTGANRYYCGGDKHVDVYATCKVTPGDCVSCAELFACTALYGYNHSCQHCRKRYEGRFCLNRKDVNVSYLRAKDTRTGITFLDIILSFLKRNLMAFVVVPTFLAIFFIMVFRRQSQESSVDSTRGVRV